MATRKIATGTLVSIKADTLNSRRRKPSEGGVGIVQGRKKRHTIPINHSNNGDEEDTTSIVTSMTTRTGTTVFDIQYTLDNRLLQDVEKETVSIAMLDTTARGRTGADFQPSLLSASHAAWAATFLLAKSIVMQEMTVVTSDNKQQGVYTAKFVIAKLMRSKHPNAKLTKQQIDKAWDGATQAKCDTCSVTAAQWVQQGPFLISELAKALSTICGSVSWRPVAMLVSGSRNLEMILYTTVCEFVMSLPDSSYTLTKLLPKLDKAKKQQQKWWAEQFWIFLICKDIFKCPDEK